jgi:serine/threonine protein kinase
MDFIEHDLKSLLTVMPNPFLQSEIKTLMLQLLSAVAHCHASWILHRDLKTSNLLMNNRGTIKVADFGLARRYGDPIGVGGMTQLVVTLWYRYVCIECLDWRQSIPIQRTGDSPRRHNLYHLSRYLVRRLHICGTTPQRATLSSQI